MKRFLINILLFFAIVVAIDFCVGFTGDYLQAHAKGGETRKTNDLVKNDYHDIVIFGSSRACHHYDASFLSDTLGLDVYNAGFDGNGVVLSYGLFSMILERYKPQLVIFDVEPAFDIEVYPSDNAHKRYISTLKPYYNDVGANEVIKDVSEAEWYKAYSGMMRYNTTILSKALDYAKGDVLNKKGYIPLHGAYTGEVSEQGERSTKNIDAFKLDYVEKLIVLANSKSVPIIVVASPKYGMTSSVGLKTVIDICDKYHVPFVDFYADSVFMQNKEWFKEPMHLNMIGAREFSRRMVKTIKKNI